MPCALSAARSSARAASHSVRTLAGGAVDEQRRADLDGQPRDRARAASAITASSSARPRGARPRPLGLGRIDQRDNAIEHLVDALAGDAGAVRTSALLAALQRLTFSLSSSGVERVDLVEHHDLGLFGQRFVIGSELAADGLVGADFTSSCVPSIRWISTAQRSTWPRKRSPMPGAFVRALDQPRNVGQHEIALADRGRRRDWGGAW